MGRRRRRRLLQDLHARRVRRGRLYEQQTHHLLCPCHQSTFDLTEDCDVIFGPAKRALPQLKITVDDEGYLVAPEGFAEPVGPSFWERDERHLPVPSAGPARRRRRSAERRAEQKPLGGIAGWLDDRTGTAKGSPC